MNRQQRRQRTEPVSDVMMATVHPGEYSSTYGYCSKRLHMYEALANGRLVVVNEERCGSGKLVEARNSTVAHFLDMTPCDWFFSVDSDMGFPAESLTRLLASADPVERPIVGGLCFALRQHGNVDEETLAIPFRMNPTVYVWCEKEDDDGEVCEVGFQVVTDYPRDQLVHVSASGAAFFLCHRTVLEEMRERFGDNWFTPVTHPLGTVFSEDMSFFVRVAGIDKPVWVDTSVKTSHDKGGIFLTEETWDEQQFLVKNYLTDEAVA